MPKLTKIPTWGAVILTALFFGLIPYWLPLLVTKAIGWGIVYGSARGLGLRGDYAKAQLISIDQHGSSLMGFDPDIVISALVQVYDFWLFNLLRPILNWIEFEHTRNALGNERGISTSNLFFKI